MEEVARGVNERVVPLLRQLQELALEYPYTAAAMTMVILVAVAIMSQTMKSDPDGPHVSRRGLGALRAALFLQRAKFWRALVGPRRWWQRQHRFGILGRLYAAEFGILIGGTGSGKTMRVVIPYVAWLILRRQSSVLVTDPKAEILKFLWPLMGIVGGRPPVHLLSTLRKHSNRDVGVVNPIRDRESRMRFIDTILPDPVGADPSWNQRARAMLLSVADTLDKALEGSGKEVDLPKVYEVLKDPRKLDDLAEFDPTFRGVWAGQDNRTHESVRTTALAPLGGLEDERIRRLFESTRAATIEESAGPSFRKREFVWLCMEGDDIQRMGPLASATVDYLRDRAMHRDEEAPEVELVVEEAGTCFPNHKLDQFVNYGRGRGVRALLVYQDYNQLQSALGERRAESVVGAMELQIYGPTRSVSTANLLEEISGTTHVKRLQPRAQPSFTDMLTGNTRIEPKKVQEQEVPRITSHQLYSLKQGHFYVYSAPNTLELVRARRALWPKYARLIMPKESAVGNLRLVRTSHPNAFWTFGEIEDPGDEIPEEANNHQEGGGPHPAPAEEPDQLRQCRTCGWQVPAGAESCDGCGASA